MRCVSLLAVAAALSLSAPVLATETNGQTIENATLAPAQVVKKRRVCSEVFETGSLVKSQKSCRPVRKSAAAKPAPAETPSVAPTGTP